MGLGDFPFLNRRFDSDRGDVMCHHDFFVYPFLCSLEAVQSVPCHLLLTGETRRAKSEADFLTDIHGDGTMRSKNVFVCFS